MWIFFPARDLGFFTAGVQCKKNGRYYFITVIQKVSYPLLSKTADDSKRMKRGYRQVIQTSTFIIFPGMVLLFIFAEPVMVYVLGPQWQPAAAFLKIICVHGGWYNLHAIYVNDYDVE